MNLARVMTEIGRRLEAMDGIRVFDYPPGSVVPPAGVVSYPDKINYDQTYQRGMDTISGLTVVLVSGKATDRTARDLMGEWTAGEGRNSVKQVLEATGYLSCDEVSVIDADFDVISIAGVEYLAATFSVDVAGMGTK